MNSKIYMPGNRTLINNYIDFISKTPNFGNVTGT
jgi:hypothetical protein